MRQIDRKYSGIFCKMLCFAAFCTIFLVNSYEIAKSASGDVRFNGFVLPKSGQTITYGDELISFTDSIALPIPATLNQLDKIKIYTGEPQIQIDYEIIRLPGPRQEYAALVDIDEEYKQSYQICRSGNGGCIEYDVLKME